MPAYAVFQFVCDQCGDVVLDKTYELINKYDEKFKVSFQKKSRTKTIIQIITDAIAVAKCEITQKGKVTCKNCKGLAHKHPKWSK